MSLKNELQALDQNLLEKVLVTSLIKMSSMRPGEWMREHLERDSEYPALSASPDLVEAAWAPIDHDEASTLNRGAALLVEALIEMAEIAELPSPE